MQLSSGFFCSALKDTAPALAAGLFLFSVNLHAAPDLGSRNALALSQDMPVREMEGATATDGVWAAAGGRRLYDGSGMSIPGFNGESVTVSGPWDGSGASKITISPPNALEEFGASLAIKGNRIAIGSPSTRDETITCGEWDCFYSYEDISAGGRVWLYLHDGTTFQSEREIAHGGLTDRFGQSVALTASHLLAGAPGAAPATAHVFDPGTGALLETFSSPDNGGSDRFGQTVALADDLALVGAPESANVYVYRNDGSGNWTAAGILTSPGSGSEFGAALAADGDRILVGAPGLDKAYLFEDAGGSSWPVVAEFSGSANSKFGHAVAISGDTAWVSAPEQLVFTLLLGVVRQYERDSGGAWPLANTLTAASPFNNPVQMNEFGYALAASPTILSVISLRPGNFPGFLRGVNDVFTSTSLILDADSDTVSDLTDNCSGVSNADQSNIDADSFGDACDNDIDGDGLSNSQEATLGTDPANPDTDGDGLSDYFDPAPLQVDPDGDGVSDGDDNCVFDANPGQENLDNDNFGDVCDDDIDGDTISNDDEIANGTDPLNLDTDGDDIWDAGDEFPSDVNDGWAYTYRFPYPNVTRVAAGSAVVLAATTNALSAYEPGAAGLGTTTAPSIAVPADHAISRLVMQGSVAAILVASNLDSTSTLYIYERSAAGSWMLRDTQLFTALVSKVNVQGDTLVVEQRFYNPTSSQMTFFQYSAGSGYAQVASHTTGGSSSILIDDDIVLQGDTGESTVSIYPLSGGAPESFTLPFENLGGDIFRMNDGRYLIRGLSNKEYWLEQNPDTQVWSLTQQASTLWDETKAVGESGAVVLVDAPGAGRDMNVVSYPGEQGLGLVQGRTEVLAHQLANSGNFVVMGDDDWLDIFLVDRDGDAVPDTDDNCRDAANADQADADSDGVGDVCDLPPGC